MPGDADQPGGGRQGVAVVVVNYRTWELTREAVRSVADDPLVDQVVVVDNGSGDGSGGLLRSAIPDPRVRVVESPSNLGFGRGANLGIAATGAPLIFLLNSDAVASPGTLTRLSRVLADDPRVGVVAPAVYLADGRTLQPDAFGPLPVLGALLRTDAGRRGRRRRRPVTDPGWVSGAAMMFRRSDFLSLGGFDPDFTMYLEDVDLCRRFRARGMRVTREPSASVVHLGGRSSVNRPAQVDQFHRSKAVYLQKAGAGRFQLRCAAVLRITRVGVERLRAGPRRARG